MPAAQVFKTLCVRGDKNGVMFAVIPGDGELDLKALAKVSGNKRAELVHLKEVLPFDRLYPAAVALLWVRKRIILYIWMLLATTGRKSPSVQVNEVCRLFCAPSDLQKAANAVVADLIFAK